MTSAFESTGSLLLQNRTRFAFSGAFVIGAVLCSGSSAQAQPAQAPPAQAPDAPRPEDAETRVAARDLAAQGGQAFDAGHYAEANDFFSRAYELVHAPSIGLMRARSLAKLGQLLEAIDSYEQTARFKLPADAPDAYVSSVEMARTEVEEVRRRVPRLKLWVTNATPSMNAQVTIDDKPTPAALLGVDRPIDPGSHRVALQVSGRNRVARELNLEEGKRYNVELDASAEPAAGPPAQSAPTGSLKASASGESSSATSLLQNPRTLGYIGVGVGGLGLIIGTYTGLVALHRKSQLDDACHPGCPESSAADLSGFRYNRTVSWVSYGVGIAAAATGVWLLTLGDPKQEHVALGVMPGGVQIGGRL